MYIRQDNQIDSDLRHRKIINPIEIKFGYNQILRNLDL